MLVQSQRQRTMANCADGIGATALAVLAVASVVALGGCASCSTNPADAGFFCGAQNVSAGTYEVRQADLAVQATAAEAAADRRYAEASALKRTATGLADERSTLETRLKGLTSASAKIRGRLAEARLNRGLLQGDAARLEAEARDLDLKIEDLRRTRPQPTVQAISAVETSAAVLEKKIDDILTQKRKI